MMRIFVRNLTVQAQIGAKRDEMGRCQPVVIDLEAAIAPPDRDAVTDTVDYAALADIAREIASRGHIVLVETLARRIAEACLALPGVLSIDVSVIKPEPLAPALVGARLSLGAL